LYILILWFGATGCVNRAGKKKTSSAW
jgi:hypothetical protein